MRARRRSERDEDEALDRQAPAAVMRAASPGSVLDLVQRGAGNASVSRMLARQAVPVPEAEQEGQGTPVVAPHDPGSKPEDLHDLAGSPGGLAGAFGGKREAAPVEAAPGPDIAGPQQTAAPTEAWAPDAKKDKPQVPKEITDWFGEQPSTNATIADWLLRGKGYGFLKFTSRALYEQQIRDISLRRTRVTVLTSLEGAQGTIPIDPEGQIGALIIVGSLVRGHARRWIADPSAEKTTAEAGDLLRNLQGLAIPDAHGGASADLYQHFDWDGASGPAQVLQALGDLPSGSYRLGLPFQGQFFPNERYLWTRQAAAIAAAGPNGTPAAITQPSMIKFTNGLYTSTWNPTKPTRRGVGGYDDTPTGGQHGGVAELRSADLRRGIADLRTRGISITAVFADNDNHIHITRD
jgi:hypothetical protein